MGSSEESEDFTSEEVWARMVDDLAPVGIDNEALMDVVRALCTILHLGNIEFARDPSTDECVIATMDKFKELTKLLGLTKEELTRALTQRAIVTSRDTLYSNLSPEVEKESADALSKEVYTRIFDYLVKTINIATDVVALFF